MKTTIDQTAAMPINGLHLLAIRGYVRRGLFLIGAIIIASHIAWGWYLTNTLRQNEPQFILMDPAKTLYLSESQDLFTSREFHAAQGKRALEALFDRGPNGPDHPGRLKLLFTKGAHEKAHEHLSEEAHLFRERDLHQKLEVYETEVLFTHAQPVRVHVSVQLIRTTVFHDHKINEFIPLEVQFSFIANPSMLSNGLAPTVVQDFTITELTTTP